MVELVSRFYDSTEEDKREYSAGQWSEVFKFLAGNGVMPGEGKEFNVRQYDPVQMKVYVDSGVCFIQGRFGLLSAMAELDIEPAHVTYNRIDRVVLRLNLTSDKRKITLEVKTGTPTASPTAPELTRTETIWEISVAKITVAKGVTSINNANITSERNDYTVCGYSLPFGWLVAQRTITAPREDEIVRDGDGNITETRHYIPQKNGGTLRWKEVLTRDGEGNITKITRTAYANDGITVVHTAVETITRDQYGSITGVVTE